MRLAHFALGHVFSYKFPLGRNCVYLFRIQAGVVGVQEKLTECSSGF